LFISLPPFFNIINALFSKEELSNIKEGLYLLEQDPREKTVFGKVAKNGWEPQHIVEGVPVKRKKIKYTGRVFIDGSFCMEKLANYIAVEYSFAMSLFRTKSYLNIH